MTSSPEPADDGQIPPEETKPPSDASSAPPEAAEASASGVGGPSADEGLPEWEPLTPELVEDEAIRGDFVIRWAVVGLALLFGFSQIDETRTLVHIRTGEYLATHGILPPAVDVLSYTAGDRRWVNLSWLFDLCAAGVHQIGGGIGLSILQGLLAGIAFALLSHIYRPGIRTWWGSICAALALLACYPQLTVQPELLTLVGLAGLLWIIVQVDETCSAKTLWLSVPLIWVWSQFDPRAFLGWFLLLAMAVGEGLRRGDNGRARRRMWWRVALVSTAVAAIHPFLWESWLSPVRLFSVDYPALQQIFSRPVRNEVAFYPIITFPLHGPQVFWNSINHDSIAALVLFAATIVTLVLNRERLHPGHVLAVVLFNLLACLATHEWAAASLVNCVVCTVNAQTWYRQRFGQIYSVDWRELLFSRGGRAITVFCLFGLAWMVISGRIDGPGGKRTGVGFDNNLLVQIDSYRQIATRSFDDRPFHFSARQGDLLIWTGQRSFIDSRAGLFTGKGDNDLLALQNRTRKAIRAVHQSLESDANRSQQKGAENSGSSDPKIWRETFSKYQITHAMPRLSGPIPVPDYITLGDLVSDKDWVLTDLVAATAAFYVNTSDGPLGEFVSSHRLDFVKSAFRMPPLKPEDPRPETVRETARPATTYDNLFSLRQPNYPAGVQEAGHYLQLGGSGSATLSVRAACAMLAIRRATAGLREDSNSPDGYRILGLAELLLDRVETTVMKEAGNRWFAANRYFQAVTALQQAALLRPDDMAIHSDLLGLYERTQRGELALEQLRQIKRLRPPLDTPELRKQWEPLINEEFSLVEASERIEQSVNQQLQNGADRFQVAAMANQAGAVRTAIRVLEEEAIYKEQNPAAKNALGAWLLEAGRIQDGLDTLESVEQSSTMAGAPGWRDSVATGLLVNAEYLRAIRLWSEQLRDDTTNSITSALMTLPFQEMNPLSDQYPFTHVAAVSEILGRLRGDVASLQFKIAMTELEIGDNVAAAGSLQRILENDPQTPMLPLIKFYLQNLTGNQIDATPKSALDIEEFEVLGEEPPAKKNSPAQDKPSDDGAGQKSK